MAASTKAISQASYVCRFDMHAPESKAKDGKVSSTYTLSTSQEVRNPSRGKLKQQTFGVLCTSKHPGLLVMASWGGERVAQIAGVSLTSQPYQLGFFKVARLVRNLPKTRK